MKQRGTTKFCCVFELVWWSQLFTIRLWIFFTSLRRTSEIDNKLRSKNHELEEAQKRVDKLEDHIRQSESSLEEQKRLRQVR